MGNKEIRFQNKWYSFTVDPTGRITIADTDQKKLLNSVTYSGEYGEVYNIRWPLSEGDQRMVLDRTEQLLPGDNLEIRNEFRRGLMNRPLVHPITITEVEQNTISFTPPVKENFCNQQIVSQKLCVSIRKVTTRASGLEQIKTSLMTDRKTGMKTVELIGETPVATVTIRYLLSQESPALQVTIFTRYKRDVTVFDESLALTFAESVREIYRKNRQVDTDHFKDAYWLDKQGVRFGSGSRAIIFYHLPQVSSLFLQPEKKQLDIRLDHMQDHRYAKDTFGLVFQKKSIRVLNEYHASEYKAGEKRVNRFCFTVGAYPEALPRLMLCPDGYEAAFAWTEHADASTLNSHRAAYFGDERISHAQKAVGGFVRYGIPVTKSVFYTNPTTRSFNGLIPLAEQSIPGLEPQVAVKEDMEFREFLQQLHACGNEICLHAVSPSSEEETSERLQEAVSFMKEHFQSQTWIDHGRNRFNFSTIGLDPELGYYAGDLWERFGTKYFWHYATEDITHWKEGNINLFQLARGDQLPTPLFWQHPTRTGSFYSWAVISTSTISIIHKESLAKLVEEWGICINHVYPPELRDPLSKSEFLYRDENGILKAHSVFNELLAVQARLRDEGKLLITTVPHLLEYWRSLEHVRFEYTKKGKVLIYNDNRTSIKGFSLGLRNPQGTVLVNGKTPHTKRVRDDLIVWFTLPARSMVELSIAPSETGKSNRKKRKHT